MTSKARVGSANNARRKLALVIGIVNYSKGANVPNALNDAENMSSALKSIGFIIYGNGPQLNLKKPNMTRTLADFKSSVNIGDVVLFYFAGHGKQWEDQNYLIPSNDYTDDGIKEVPLSGSDLTAHAINAQRFLETIIDQKPFVTIFFLDCCRTYYLRNEDITRGEDEPENHSRGLASISANAGSVFTNARPIIGNGGLVISFACAPGTTADDGQKGQRNGLFTKHLLRHILKPNEDIRMVLSDVTNGVMEESKSAQIPYVTCSLRHKNIYLFEQPPAETWPASESQLAPPKNNHPFAHYSPLQWSMSTDEKKKIMFNLLMGEMMTPVQSRDGRLMDEDGYYNDDGTRSFS